MSILSKEELMELNYIMLGKGAPVDIDGVGYNKIDYAKMAYLCGKSNISDNEAYVLSSVLLKYTNTQLSHKADRIKETVQHYQKAYQNDFTNHKKQKEWSSRA